MAKTLRVGMVGYGFMGKAHSNAWRQAPRFFPLKAHVELHTICGRSAAGVQAARLQFGWQNSATDWREVVDSPLIDVVDINTPNDSHAEIAIAAARAGKHILCEKPLALTTKQAEAMLAAVQKAKIVHMVCHNYRRIPAIVLAKKMINEGVLGQIYHFHARYAQDWLADPEFPLKWRLQKSIGGSGAHGDINVHIMDLARYLVGEFKEVCGVMQTFIKDRPLTGEPGKILSPAAKALEKRGKVTVDDAVTFIGRFENGALANLEAMGNDVGAQAESAAVRNLLNLILLTAVKAQAADIHFEPFEENFRVRNRIDGVLYEMLPVPKQLAAPLVARIKVMSHLDIAERRLPQDGKIPVRIGDREVDLRVSTLPTIFGESVVVRILDRQVVNLDIEKIGFPDDQLAYFKEVIERPNGIVVVTGPTGSGKTTTLYATLNTLNTIDRKIITAEDPVEYHLNGINQCQVRHKIGFDFPRILRSMLRQAPNVILVGEIRDAETAQIAIQASLTGHLVFSTLHTNDAPSAITRLIDMGVQPFLVATSIQAVLAQRLIRINCPKCQEKYTPDAKTLLALNLRPEQHPDLQLVRGKGCDYCKGTGYRGRKGIFEMMVMNRQIRDLAFEKAPTNEVRKAAIANGMTSLAMDGVRKVLSGMTTPDEIMRVAKADD